MPRLVAPGPTLAAVSSLAVYSSLILNGNALRGDVAAVLRDARHTRSIDGVNTVTLELYDDAQKLLESGIFNQRNTLRISGRDFETVQVRKSGPTLSLTFEDFIVSSLRKRDEPFKVAPNTTNHVAFVRRMVQQVPGAKFFFPPGTVPKGNAPTELARGNPSPTERTKEDSWTAIRRIGDERGWRAFTRGKTIMYAPETWLLAQRPAYRLTELTGGVDYIDFDFDIGKPVATVKLKVRSQRFEMHVGDVIELYSMGPANGKWLISEISRSLFDLHADVTCTKARPVLPEPAAASKSGGSDGEAPTVTFGDGRQRTYALGAVKPHVREAAVEVGSKYSIATVYGVGQRSVSTSDHPLGYALDFMCSRAQGDALADFVHQDAGRLKVKYLIWQQRIRYPEGGWQNMADRGSATANHVDHVHVSFNR